MTIKPLVVAPSQKRGVNTADKEEGRSKETHSHNHGHAHAVLHSGHNHGVVGEQSSSHSQQNVVGRAASHSHRNVVIDSHGQSPQRRAEVYDELARHRRSPHKSSRSKRREHHDHHHNKREREKHGSVVVPAVVSGKCSSPHVHGVVAGTVANSAGASSPANVGGKSPEHLSGMPVVLGCPSPKSQNAVTQATANMLKAVEDTYSGYNSGDEHLQPKESAITADEWQRRDEQFAKCMTERGYILKPVEEDGACLFRSISLQIYGDEEMHDVIRQQTMDYINKNREYFCHFVTEDINSYIKRKRRKDSHGNHIEIQAISEIYSRPVEVYCYKSTPINIFNSEQLNNGYAPLRLSYQRGSHYNAIIDPYNATVGVGLGLAGYKPELQTKEAVRLSEQLEIEQTMFEDKLKTTDWEATNEAIEEQIARESYLQWCRENLQKSRAASAAATSTSATVTSAEAASASDAEASPSKYSLQRIVCSGGSSSTVTAAAMTVATHAADKGAAADGASPAAGSVGMAAASSAAGSGISSLTMLEHNRALSPKSLNSLAHNLKKDVTVVGGTCDLGFDSDDTDMSSTSSMGNAGNASPSSTGSRVKKSKGRAGAVRGSKKRRRDHNTTALGRSDSTPLDGSARKSPKRDLPIMAAAAGGAAVAVAATAMQDTRTRAITPEVEQLPSTSKQSHTPEKHTHAGEKKSSSPSSSRQVVSNFYQELLAASYTTDAGVDQLNDSEMLQRAIQMSTQAYIEDQKRKYLYMGHK